MRYESTDSTIRLALQLSRVLAPHLIAATEAASSAFGLAAGGWAAVAGRRLAAAAALRSFLAALRARPCRIVEIVNE